MPLFVSTITSLEAACIADLFRTSAIKCQRKRKHPSTRSVCGLRSWYQDAVVLLPMSFPISSHHECHHQEQTPLKVLVKQADAASNPNDPVSSVADHHNANHLTSSWSSIEDPQDSLNKETCPSLLAHLSPTHIQPTPPKLSIPDQSTNPASNLDARSQRESNQTDA